MTSSRRTPTLYARDASSLLPLLKVYKLMSEDGRSTALAWYARNQCSANGAMHKHQSTLAAVMSTCVHTVHSASLSNTITTCCPADWTRKAWGALGCIASYLQGCCKDSALEAKVYLKHTLWVHREHASLCSVLTYKNTTRMSCQYSVPLRSRFTC